MPYRHLLGNAVGFALLRIAAGADAELALQGVALRGAFRTLGVAMAMRAARAFSLQPAWRPRGGKSDTRRRSSRPAVAHRADHDLAPFLTACLSEGAQPSVE